MSKMFKLIFDGVKHIQPCLRTDPEFLPFIFQDIINNIAGDAVSAFFIMPVCRKMPCVTVEAAYTTSPCSYPQIAIFTLNDTLNKIIADTVLIERIIFVYFDCIPIVFIQSLPGTKPHKAAAILRHTKYITLRKAFSGSYVVKLYMMVLRKCKKIKAVQKY